MFKLQISAFFLFSYFRKRQIALYSPCRLVGRSVNCSSRQLFNGIIFLATIIPPFLYKSSFANRAVVQMTKIKGTEDHRLLQMIIRMIRPPPFLWKWSFAKRTILQITKIKGMEEHRLLQMTILMIWPPPCSSAPLQMVICKGDDLKIWLTLTLKCVDNCALPVRWKVSRVIEYLLKLSQSSLSITDCNRKNKDQNSNKRFALFTWSSFYAQISIFRCACIS